MSTLVDVCTCEELPPGRAVSVDHGRERIAVFNIAGEYYACTDRCPHAGAPLHQAFVSGKTIICPWHGWSFDLTCPGDSAGDGVRRYPVRVENDTIQVEIA